LLTGHLSHKHRALPEWSPEKFIEQAAAMSEDIERYIRLADSYSRYGFLEIQDILNSPAQSALLEEVDYTFERELDRNQVECIACMDFIREQRDLFITGPTGMGKSYLATAPGNNSDG
jgi:DNA replication protein DnaC